MRHELCWAILRSCLRHGTGGGGSSVFTFTSSVPFGSGGVDHYHYIWDQSPTHSFTGTETVWSGGVVQETISDSSTWYLHLLSHNPNQESGGTAHIQVSAGSAYVFADFNNNCYVDSADLTTFVSCVAGPSVPYPNRPECTRADADHDGDVDASDFGVFQRCFSGPDMPADPNCAN